MGIQGLLKGLNPLLVPPSTTSTPTAPPTYNISQFQNATLAIDASSWLHKAAYSCAEPFVEALENNTRNPQVEQTYSRYMTRRCDELISQAGIAKIYLVFDGKRCPMKRGTNVEREEKRQKNLREARRFKSEGRMTEAYDRYRCCIKVTEEMGRVVAREVRKKWGRAGGGVVECVFSPYEADAQLAKLCLDGYADAVVTEDSDVIVYSAACRTPFPIIYKLDRNSGSCDVITMDWLLSSSPDDAPNDRPHLDISSMKRFLPDMNQTECKREKKGGSSRVKGNAFLSTLRHMYNKERKTPGSGVRMFIQACVLSGCDYAPSQLHKVGPITSFKFIKEQGHRSPEKRFFHLLKALPREKILESPDNSKESSSDSSSTLQRRKGDRGLDTVVSDYEKLLSQSEAVFYYHHVLQMSDGSTVPLVEPRLSSSTKNNDCFLPDMARFNDDMSFVGSVDDGETCDKENGEDDGLLEYSPFQELIQNSQQLNESSLQTGRSGEEKENNVIFSEQLSDQHLSEMAMPRKEIHSKNKLAKPVANGLEDSLVGSILQNVHGTNTAKDSLFQLDDIETRFYTARGGKSPMARASSSMTMSSSSWKGKTEEVGTTNPFASFAHGSVSENPKRNNNNRFDKEHNDQVSDLQGNVRCSVDASETSRSIDGLFPDKTKQLHHRPVESVLIAAYSASPHFSTIHNPQPHQHGESKRPLRKVPAEETKGNVEDESEIDEDIVDPPSPCPTHTRKKRRLTGSIERVDSSLVAASSTVAAEKRIRTNIQHEETVTPVVKSRFFGGSSSNRPTSLPRRVTPDVSNLDTSGNSSQCKKIDPARSKLTYDDGCDDDDECVVIEFPNKLPQNQQERYAKAESDNHSRSSSSSMAFQLRKNSSPLPNTSASNVHQREHSVQRQHYISPFQSSNRLRIETAKQKSRKPRKPILDGLYKQQQLAKSSSSSSSSMPKKRLFSSQETNAFSKAGDMKRKRAGAITSFFQPKPR